MTELYQKWPKGLKNDGLNQLKSEKTLRSSKPNGSRRFGTVVQILVDVLCVDVMGVDVLCVDVMGVDVLEVDVMGVDVLRVDVLGVDVF